MAYFRRSRYSSKRRGSGRRFRRRRYHRRRRRTGALPGRSRVVRMTTYFRKTLTTAVSDGTDVQTVTTTASPFSPNVPFTGKQPYYRDQWATLYTYGRVLGWKMTTTFHHAGLYDHDGVTPVGGIVCGMSFPEQEFDATMTPGACNVDEALSIPNTRAVFLSPNVDHITVVHKGSTKKYLQVHNIKDALDVQVQISTPGTDTPTVDPTRS